MNDVIFLLYMHRREFLFSYVQDFSLSSSTFHIYTFTIFMGILLSVIHPCEMVIISITRPQTWLILMFNNGQTLHFVRPQTRLLLGVQSTRLDVSSSIAWICIIFIVHCMDEYALGLLWFAQGIDFFPSLSLDEQAFAY